MQSMSVTTHNNYWKIALNCSDNEKIFRSIIICKNVLLLFFPFLKFVILDSTFLLLFCVEFACSFCALWHCHQLSRDMHYRLMVFNECVCNSWSAVTGTLANKAILAKTAMLLTYAVVTPWKTVVGYYGMIKIIASVCNERASSLSLKWLL